MGGKSIDEISSEVLWFEITHFSNINRVLNLIENDNISDEDKIHHLRILIKSMNENDVTFNTPKNQKKTMQRFINIFLILTKKLWNHNDCKRWLLKIHNWLEKYLRTIEFNSFAFSTRYSIERILNTGSQTSYATASHRVEWRSVRM